jgi:hypothetical protein
MNPLNQSAIRIFFLGGFASLAVCAAASAQVVEPMGSFGEQRNSRMQPTSAQEQSAPAPAPAQPQAASRSTAAPHSLLDKPPQPAKIDLAQGQLAIHADNSSLIDIMHRLTADAGMTVDGLNKDQRVFGSYGPADPQEVISELLDGMGYNVVMLGRTEAGTPKQVTLTPRVGGVPNGSGGIRPQPMNQDDETDDDQPQPIINNPVVEPPQQVEPHPGGGVRTPQQMLQELQQMRQQQMQQLQQQQQNPPQSPPPQQQ